MSIGVDHRLGAFRLQHAAVRQRYVEATKPLFAELSSLSPASRWLSMAGCDRGIDHNSLLEDSKRRKMLLYKIKDERLNLPGVTYIVSRSVLGVVSTYPHVGLQRVGVI